MKKIILFLLLCLIFCTASVSANYIVDRNFDNGVIKISATIPEAVKNRLVFLQILSPDESSDNISINDNSNAHMVMTDENGNFEYTAKVQSDASSDEYNYTLVVSAYDMQNPYTEKFYLCPSSVLMPVLSQLAQKSTASEIAVVFLQNKEILSFVSDELFALPEAARNAIYGGLSSETEFASIEEFNQKFYNLYVPQKINNISSADAVKEVFASYEKYINFKNSDIYSEFSNLPEAKKDAVYAYMAGRGGINMTTLMKSAAEGSVLSLLSLTGNIASTEGLLTAYEQKIGLNLSNVRSMKEPGKAYAAVTGKSYATIPLLQSALDEEALKENKNTDNVPVSRPAGGSSGGGGGISVPTNLVMPEPPVKTESVVGFSDLASVPWAEKAINYLSKNSIVNGYADNLFMPQGEMLREEFVAIVVRAYDLPQDGITDAFYDVSETAWYAEYVASAYFCDIINGLNETTFGVGQKITRQDVSVILKRIMDYTGKNFSETREYSGFLDNDELSEYARPAVEALFKGSIINGDNMGNFNPKAFCTRAECSVMLYNMLTGGGVNE